MASDRLKVVVEFNNGSLDDDSDSSSTGDEFRSSRRLGVVSGETVLSNFEVDQDMTLGNPEPVTVNRTLSLPTVKTYENKGASMFVTGFDPTSKHLKTETPTGRRMKSPLSGEEFKKKQELRAKRFGEQLPEAITEDAIERLYESLGIDATAEENSTDERGIRFNTLHVRGVNDMSTQRVFDYFAEFAASAIEWVDDASCNVVWLDKIGAMRALLKLSRDAKETEKDHLRGEQLSGVEHEVELKEQPELESKMMDDDDELNLLCDDDVAKLKLMTVTAEENKALHCKVQDSEKNSDQDVERMETDSDSDSDKDSEMNKHRFRGVRPSANELKIKDSSSDHNNTLQVSTGIPWPPGKWRLGIPSEHAKWLFMRFATKADQKVVGAGRRSEYYRKYGNPNFGGMKGIISKSRRRQMYQGHQAEFESGEVEDDNREQGEIVSDEDFTEIVAKRLKMPRHRRPPSIENESSSESVVQPKSDVEVADNQQSLLDENQLFRLNEPKRSMRMYSDDIEKKSASDRLGSRRNPSTKEGLRGEMRERLNHHRSAYQASEPNPGDAWSQLARRKDGDEVELDRRADESHDSQKSGDVWGRLACNFDDAVRDRIEKGEDDDCGRPGNVWSRIARNYDNEVRRVNDDDGRGKVWSRLSSRPDDSRSLASTTTVDLRSRLDRKRKVPSRRGGSPYRRTVDVSD